MEVSGVAVKSLPLFMRRRLADLSGRFPDVYAVLPIFLLSRIAFYCATMLGYWLIPEAIAEPARVAVNAPPWLMLHWRWDAVHYHWIAVNGYERNGLLAFFPLFPLLFRIVTIVLGGFQAPLPGPISGSEREPLLAGVFVAHAAAFVAFWLLHKLARDETADAGIARRSSLYAAIFPLAFYYCIPYTESLFLAASVGMFLMARRGHWILAGVFAAAGSATRPFGMLLAVALAVEVAVAWRRGLLPRSTWVRAASGLLISPLGLLLFMLYLQQRFGDPLAFLHIQSAWDHARQFPLVTLQQGIAYAVNPSWTEQRDLYGRGVLNLAVVLAFLVILLLSLRHWRLSYIIYGLLLFAFVLSAPQSNERVMHALGRYVMLLFPVYISLGRWGRFQAVHYLLLAVFLPLFGLLAGIWISWYPVA